ncbi:MAG: hypothetical protein ACRDF5_07805 [bacterium]
MRGEFRRGSRLAGITAGATAAFLLVALAAPVAQGQAIMSVHACRRLDVRQVPQGTQVTYLQCGTQFTAADPYIAVVAHLRQIRSRTVVVVELLDPDQAVVWTRRGAIEPPEGSDIYYSDLWLYGLLPLSIDPVRLVAENPAFAFGLIRPSGRPVRDRVGEWTLRAVLNNGSAMALKFTLQAAPGAPAASPTPASSPTPEPSPSP